ncbi:uncharacterized protein LOC109839102 isoform X2 [Asparagus officinalis]|uniref:uncharacterized protein LOC109839102 isoform X2 n=1 Tax=Asparagus officinalis TaxID=4686 RepID=UPI00098E0870|nr:uncharacterized protein LOC109839102 isoform X2 [Asparagus officinalis]
MAFRILAIAAAFFVSVRVSSSGSASPAVVSRIAFGSCANQSADQPIWNAIIDFDPQLFIWLGDNIYGDNRRPFSILGKERTIGPWKNVPRFFPSSEEQLKKSYEIAKSNPGYSALRRRSKVIGTWDDHDYGLNDAGKEFSGKDTSQRLLLDFLDEAEDSPRRKQAGVYASYLFGPTGKQIKLEVCNMLAITPDMALQVILLDTRYHRDPFFSDGSILGETQWEWLQQELSGPGSEITIIASSIQVISNLSASTGPYFYVESWGRFPKERKRLYELIADSKRNGILFISGDVHFGEIARYDCGTDYPLYDITSSGLTQSVENAVPQPLPFLIRAAAWLIPSTLRVYSPKCRYKSCTYGKPNFGVIEIDWDASPQSIKIEVRDVNGNPVTGVELLLSELQSGYTHKTLSRGVYQKHCTLEVDLPWFLRYRLSFLLFGALIGAIVVLILLTVIMLSLSKRFLRKYKID